MQSAAEHAFETERSPDDKTWTKLKPSTVNCGTKFGHTPIKILTQSSDLKRSILAQSGKDFAEAGTNLAYATTYQFGAGKGLFGTTKRGSMGRHPRQTVFRCFRYRGETSTNNNHRFYRKKVVKNGNKNNDGAPTTTYSGMDTDLYIGMSAYHISPSSNLKIKVATQRQNANAIASLNFNGIQYFSYHITKQVADTVMCHRVQ